jgi:hypothetical protein
MGRNHLHKQKVPKDPSIYLPNHAIQQGHRVLASVSRGYPRLVGSSITCYSPVRHSTRLAAFAFDLHASSTPPTFVLSQDQTLHFEVCSIQCRFPKPHLATTRAAATLGSGGCWRCSVLEHANAHTLSFRGHPVCQRSPRLPHFRAVRGAGEGSDFGQRVKLRAQRIRREHPGSSMSDATQALLATCDPRDLTPSWCTAAQSTIDKGSAGDSPIAPGRLRDPEPGAAGGGQPRATANRGGSWQYRLSANPGSRPSRRAEGAGTAPRCPEHTSGCNPSTTSSRSSRASGFRVRRSPCSSGSRT